MFHSPKSQRSNNASDSSQLRKVRKGTRSCWECKRRKIRCIFGSETSRACKWCLSHGSNCVSQQHPDSGNDPMNNPTLQDRIIRVECMLERLLQKTEDEGRAHNDQSDNPMPALTVVDNIGVDVVDSSLATLFHPPRTAVLNVFQNISFQSEIGGTETPTLCNGNGASSLGQTTFLNDAGKTSKLEKVSRFLLRMIPPREVIAVLDEESSPWICQLLRALPSLHATNKFSLLNAMPVESSSVSHPTFIARALICIVVCLQQLRKDFDFARLQPLSLPVDHYVASVTETVCTFVTSNDEIVATPEGIECLILLVIFFINTGKPRRAWLSNRRALSVAQLMGLHNSNGDSVGEAPGGERKYLTGLWPHIVHSDRYLSLVLGFPYGATETNQPSVSSLLRELPEDQQDMLYVKGLDQIAARIIDREQYSTTSAFAATQSIDDALENLAQSVPATWWQPPDGVIGMETKMLSKIYNRLNVQLWHHQLSLALHLPFMLDPITQRKYEYSRFSCLNSARELIKRYLLIRSNFGMFSCCLTNFEAFTAAVILIFNLFMPHPTFEHGDLSRQRGADWSLVRDVINALDKANEQYHDVVALQASNVLKLLRKVEENPHDEEGDHLTFTIPYFGTISIARRPRLQSADPLSSMFHLPPDSPSAFMATIDMSQPILPDADELLQQWLVEDASWPS